jgi:hypothetical protein
MTDYELETKETQLEGDLCFKSYKKEGQYTKKNLLKKLRVNEEGSKTRLRGIWNEKGIFTGKVKSTIIRYEIKPERKKTSPRNVLRESYIGDGRKHLQFRIKPCLNLDGLLETIA